MVRYSHVRLLTLAVLLCCSVAVSAQESSPVVEVSRSLETTGLPGFALPLLRQQYRATSPAQRDSIAELLVRAAISTRQTDEAYERAVTIVEALLFSGHNRTAGEPYPGSVAALLRVARDASSIDVARYAAIALGESKDEMAAATGLYDLATTSPRIAADVVRQFRSSRSEQFQRQLARLCNRAVAMPSADAERQLQLSARQAGLRAGRCAP